MSQKQLQWIKVMENVAAGRLTIGEAAELLGLSVRQVKRLKQRFDAEDVNWVYHGNRGRKPVNAVATAVRKQVIHLARGKYAGFNDHHLQENLAEQEHLRLSRQSVRRILRQAGRASPQKRRPRRYRSRRERRLLVRNKAPSARTLIADPRVKRNLLPFTIIPVVWRAAIDTITGGLSGGYGSAGKQPERRLSGRDCGELRSPFPSDQSWHEHVKSHGFGDSVREVETTVTKSLVH